MCYLRTRKSVAAPVVENIHCDVLGTLATIKCVEYLTEILYKLKGKILQSGSCALWPMLIRRQQRSEVTAPVWDQMAELPIPHHWPTA